MVPALPNDHDAMCLAPAEAAPGIACVYVKPMGESINASTMGLPEVCVRGMCVYGNADPAAVEQYIPPFSGGPGTLGHPPAGGALGEVPPPAAPASTEAVVAQPPVPSTDVSSMAVGVGLTLLVGMVAVLVLRRRKRGTSPTAPAAPEILDYPDNIEVR